MQIRELELKTLRRADRREKRHYVTGWKTAAIVFLVLALLFTPLTAGLKLLDNVAAEGLGGEFWRLKNRDENAIFGADNTPPVNLPEQTCGRIQAEGMVLLENANHALPLPKDAAVSCVAADTGRAEALQAALTESGVTAGGSTVIALLSDGTLLPDLGQRKAAGEIEKLILLWDTEKPVQPGLWKDSGADAVLWTGYGEAKYIAGILCGDSPNGSLPYTGVYGDKQEPLGSVYSGYLYYETRYEDFVMGTGNPGAFTYGEQIAYPFGFGLGYTTFAYSDMQVTYDGQTDCFSVALTITNTGETTARETAQVYAQSPYTDYDRENGVEKPAVKLVGFVKTDLLEPGTVANVVVQVPGRELAVNNLLEAGEYYLTVASHAHEGVNNILTAKGYTPENTQNRMDAPGNGALTYKWTQSDSKTYGTVNANNGTKGVSRKDWEGTMSQVPAALPQEDLQYNPGDYPTVPMPTTGAKNGLKLRDLAGVAFDDPKWQTLLDQLTVKEMATLIGDAYGRTLPIESVQAPGVRYTETTNHVLLEATFQKELAYEMGYSDAKEAGQLLLQNTDTICEDSFLSGGILASRVQGVRDAGGNAVLRMQTEPGWVQLRAYQYAVEENPTTGIWGADSRVIDIMRNEWGGKGMVLAEDVPDAAGMLAGVTGYCDPLPKTAELLSYRNDPVVVTALRQACHYYLYTLANSNAMNGIGAETVVKVQLLPAVLVCMIIAAVSMIAAVVFTALWCRGSRKWRRTEAHLAYKALKNTVKSEKGVQ